MSTAPIDPLNSEREFNYIDEDENQNQEGSFSWLSEQSADDLANDFSRRDVHQKEYLQINSRLLDSRKKIKRKMAESTNAFNQAQTDLLQTFERFLRFAEETDRPHWENEEDGTEKANVFVAAVTERVLGKTNTTSASAKFEESQQLTNMQLMKKLKKAVDIDKKKLQMAQEEVQAQQKSFNIFLQDQGRVLAVVEKAAARDKTKGHDCQRSKMYRTIVEALESSPAIRIMEPEEAEQHKKEIYQILRQLELVESGTDELVERVLLKLKAIRSEESEQGSQIEEQLQAQEGINDELDDLTEQINKNNAAIVEKTNVLREDILGAIAQIKSKNVVYAAATCLCAIVAICVGIAALFLVNQIS